MTANELSADIAARTDSYFNRTRRIVARFGDKRVTYAVFMRRPVISAPRLMVEWLETAAAARDTRFDIDLMYPEGAWVGAGEPLAYIAGSLMHLSDLETILLQKIGPASVAAHNAYQMCLALPEVAFLAMEARHCAGAEMQDMMAYAASVGSAAAKREGAKGFIGNANDGTAHWFGAPRGFGTMPHSLIGYAGSTLRAAEMFRETFPDEPMTVLADYFGREITDALAVCARFPDLAATGGCRSGWTRMAGASWKGSIRPRATRCWNATRRVRSAATAARRNCAIWSAPASPPQRSGGCARRSTRPAIQHVRIVASSGFGVDKCRVMADAKAPIDVVGTGSFIPDAWHETYATADIVEYDGVADGEGRPRVPAAQERRTQTGRLTRAQS